MRSVRTRSPASASSAFTIVELLVVIAIIGVLLSLLFPAMSSVREASRKVTCQNNLRQVGLAVQQYCEGNRDLLPPLWLSKRPRPWQNFSWRVRLLPFLEQQNMLSALDLSLEPLAESNLPTTRISVSTFECPSTLGAPRRIASLGFAESSYADCAVAASDYAAVFDVRLPSRQFPARGAWNGVPGAELDEVAPDMVPMDERSPASRSRPASLAGVRDGLSNTVLIIEQAGKPTLFRQPAGSPAPEPAEGAWATAEFSSFRGEQVNVDNQTDPFAFHNVVQFVFCDTAVQAWTPEIAPEIMRALLTADGREIIQPEDWK